MKEGYPLNHKPQNQPLSKEEKVDATFSQAMRDGLVTYHPNPKGGGTMITRVAREGKITEHVTEVNEGPFAERLARIQGEVNGAKKQISSLHLG
ncbi:hypothetical protein JXA63_03860 [Candidatus Woesebacteria bacterium]|nr:hypothetical protein [Candidatus Woesebacteria bacterium]